MFPKTISNSITSRVLGRRDRKRHKTDPITHEELHIMEKCVRPGDVVLDVGAHHGKWSEAVLRRDPSEVHVFEASRDAFDVLQKNADPRLKLNWNAVTNSPGDMTFHVYRDDARLSSLHRRISVEDQLLPGGYDAITVPGITLDQYWAGRSDQIRLLKVDVEGAEYDVLRGADGLLRRGQVDFLQFEYGGTFFDAGVSLRNVWSHLRRHGYRTLRIDAKRFTEIETFSEKLETYSYTNFLCLHERLLSPFMGKDSQIVLELDLLKRCGIQPKGVLHVGAHKGDEIDTYRKRDMGPVVFIEANPDLAAGLRKRFDDAKDVTVIECAASDKEGTATFNVTSMDQSSSLLQLKEHAALYPKIKVDQTLTVRTATLDTLLPEAGINPADIEFIAMDIQGAELMALRGAGQILETVKAVQLEINFAELYEGCPLISEVDEFFDSHGFIRVQTNTPYSETWGDALYIRRPTVTCSSVGRMGRFGNAFFQYMFIQSYAREHDYIAQTPIWAGDALFNVVPGVADLPEPAIRIEEINHDFETSSVANDPDVHPNADFSGYFQYHTRYYKPYRDQIRNEFAFKGPYAARAGQIRERFAQCTGPVIPLHLRRGDFGTGIFFIAPESWYLSWLEDMRKTHPDLTVYIASDEPGLVLPAFADFPTLTAADLPETDLPHPWFTDFAALTMGDHVAISNSSFSFGATMLNTSAKSFLRPSLSERKLVPYDPWAAPILLREQEAEFAGPEFVSDHAKTRSKYKLRNLRRFFR